MSIANKCLDSLLSHYTSYENGEITMEDGLRQCRKYSLILNRALNKAPTISSKQHILSTISKIKYIRQQFKSLKSGGSLNSRKDWRSLRVKWEEMPSAFKSRIRAGVITNLQHKDPKEFLLDCKSLFKRRISNIMKSMEFIKCNSVFCGEFILQKADSILTEYKHFTTSNSSISKDTKLEPWFDEHIMDPILCELEEFTISKSGWSLSKIINLGININKFTPELGSSYIELPPEIKKKEACINVQNDDSFCFAWAVVSALFPVNKHPQRVSKYPHYTTVLKLKGIQFPMTLNQIPNFEIQNNVSINIYILKKNKNKFITLPSYLTKSKLTKHVSLLMIQDKYNEEDAPRKFHYVWI